MVQDLKIANLVLWSTSGSKYIEKKLLCSLQPTVKSQGFVFNQGIKRSQEALKYYEDCVDIYHYFSSVNSKLPGDMCIRMRDLMFMLSDLKLVNEELTPTVIAKILSAEEKRDFSNFDIELTPLEFFESLVEMARYFVPIGLVVNGTGRTGEETAKVGLIGKDNIDAETEGNNVTTERQSSSENPSVEEGSIVTTTEGHSRKASSLQARQMDDDQGKVVNKQSKNKQRDGKNKEESREGKKEVHASKSRERTEKKSEKSASYTKVKEKSSSGKKKNESNENMANISDDVLHAKSSLEDRAASSDAIGEENMTDQVTSEEFAGEISIIVPTDSEIIDNYPLPSEDISLFVKKIEIFFKQHLVPAYEHLREVDRQVEEQKKSRGNLASNFSYSRTEIISPDHNVSSHDAVRVNIMESYQLNDVTKEVNSQANQLIERLESLTV